MWKVTAIVGAILVGSLGALAWKYDNLSDETAELRKDYNRAIAVIDNQQTEIKAFQDAQKIAEVQAKGIQDAEELNRNITTQLGGLRKSIDSLRTRSSNSLEACNKSSALAGELLGNCGERYKDVARKAELLRQDAIALDKHADLIQGLVSDLKPLEKLNGKD